MLGLALICAVICLSVLFFLGLRAFNHALLAYEERFKGQAQRNMAEIFLFFDPLQIWSAAVLCCVSTMIIVWVLSLNLMLSLICGLVLLVLPPFVFHHLKQKRLKLFIEQLPLMLSMLSSALKAGSGVQSALKTVVQEAPAPLSQEFGLVLREQRLGLSFDEALSNLSVRMPTEATYLVVSSLKIAAQTGGNLAEALERVANTLRAVKQIEDKIEALTSQGKFQAKVMVCLPIVLMFVLNIGDVQVLSMLWTTSTGWWVLAIIMLLEISGIIFIRKIVKVDI
ncbi:type II secretion system F family protein [Pelistega suis]|uniref:type II secretion system F family protein n=1 Tax=Pelistega suis TaxID=1631957 RepID=UPI00211BC516|nr:type II secretion system F family protein [Pelistega suis]MCQ9328674.1 type II secretion system F family protein [Pelistega suis]